MNEIIVPKYLYKILSVDDWSKSQSRKNIQLSVDDEEFIHFSTEEQLDKIIAKYWGVKSNYIVLKVFTEKLNGKMVFESNPGGVNKYYHLYEGSIPLEAVVEARLNK
ncbi:MAG: DUF952 domain-containing protein [Parachlamydiaceae bacterium]|nr:DUF952 domain-containing protein [Parachlamydiaceae bacterium]